MKRGVSRCVYVDRSKAGPEAMEILELLKSLPEERAFMLLGVLRARGDAGSVLSILKEGSADGDQTFHSPDTNSEGSMPSQNLLELELMAHYPKAYPLLPPIKASLLAKSNLLRSTYRPVDRERNQSSLPVDADSTDRRFQLPISPGQVVPYCDKRLHFLQVDFWTDVDVTNDFAARVISLYITTDLPVLGLFSPRLLIDDLVNQQSTFCSRFLFHSLMYLGCQMYSAFDKSAMQHATKFFEEAEKLFKEEKRTYLTMAGTVLLSISLIANGRDHAVLSYATQAMKIGQELGFFGIDGAPNAIMNENMSKKEMKARCYAAWGAFNWNVLVSLFYRQPGSESPDSAPLLPIPGENASEQHQDVEMAEEDLTEGRLIETVFPAVCNFWKIIHGARWIYNEVDDPPPARFRMSLVENKFRELINWAEALPTSMLRTEAKTHHATVLHIWLHDAILDIFRPFINKPEGQRHRFGTFSASDSSPDAVYAASVNQLKHLVVEYRTKSAASTYSILWHTGLLYLANAMLKAIEDPDRRLYLLLCIYGYEALSRPYRISEVIVQSLLSMTMRETDMPGTEAQKIINELREGRLDAVKENFEEKIRATFMVDMEMAFDHPEEAKVENLAAEFDDLALFQDFLNQDQMQM